jgi:long-chain acyl-CoA synthetase
MNVIEFLFEHAQNNRTAVLLEGEQFTYGEVLDLSRRAATLLKENGFQPGDRVAILSDNSLFWIQAYLGTLYALGVTVPLPFRIRPEQLPSLLRWLGCNFVFVRSLHLAATLVQECEQVIFVEDLSRAERMSKVRNTGGARDDSPNPPLPPNDHLAALMLTSGSASDQRAVMISHKNIIANTTSIIDALQLQNNDRVLCIMPFSYCFSTSLLHTHFRIGGTVALYSGTFAPGRALRVLDASKCTTLAGTPSVFQWLLRTNSFASNPTPTLRQVQQAGGRLAPAFIPALQEALPNAQIHIMYGQTEATARLTALPPERIADKPGSVGLPISGVETSVVDESGEPCVPRKNGEITASGDNIALGYWKDATATALRFRNGRLYTGDIGFKDEDGFFYIVDREEDFIKAAGYRFSASLVEDCIHELPSVVEVAVVGVPYRLLGEASKAYIVVKPGTVLTHKAVKHHCRRVLPHYMAPRQTVIVAELPKNASGKVMKSILRRLE